MNIPKHTAVSAPAARHRCPMPDAVSWQLLTGHFADLLVTCPVSLPHSGNLDYDPAISIRFAMRPPQWIKSKSAAEDLAVNLYLLGRSMRKRISDIRRRELAEATLLTLQEHGFKGTTVQRVSERAGMSHGLVHHYFKTKADMLEAAVLLTNARITIEVIGLLRAAASPRERIAAVIEGNFASSIYSREVTQAWASCCGEAAFNERFARILRMIQRRLLSNLLWDLKKLLPVKEAVLVANGIAMMIDGGWLKCALATEPLSREEAMRPIWEYLRVHLPEEQASKPRGRRRA